VEKFRWAQAVKVFELLSALSVFSGDKMHSGSVGRCVIEATPCAYQSGVLGHTENR